MKEEIDKLLGLTKSSEEINQVKDFLLFKKIFEKSQGKDQAERFEDSKKK